MLRDIRDAWRGLRHERGFSIAALVMLALGIAAASAIFAAVEAVMFELPLDEPDRIVTVRVRAEDGDALTMSSQQFDMWRDIRGTFDAVAAYALVSPVMTGRDAAVRLQAEAMTASMFAVLGVQPSLGRTFRDDDGAVVVLSDGFWKSTFGADPDVLGRPIVLDGVPTVVVGVMPPGFDGPRARPGDVWLPFADARPIAGRQPNLSVLARLAPGTARETARARLEAARVDSSAGRWTVQLETARENFLYQDALDRLRLLIAAGALVLLMASVNVASLLFGRNVTRRREIAVRLAMGAQRWHIVRQVAIESLLVSCGAAVLGVLLARWIVAAMVPLVPGWFPRIAQIDIDRGVAAFAALAAAITGTVVSIWPAWSASRHDLTAVMNEGGRGTSAAARRTRTALVVVEAMLAMAVLTTAAMIAGSFNRLNPTSPGFDAADRTKFSVRLAGPRYQDRGARIAAVEDIAARLRAVPGVLDVSSATNLPLTGTSTTFPTRVNGAPAVPSGPPPTIHFRAALPNYFALMGMRIVAGRGLSAADTANAQRVAVVNEALVARVLSGRDPLSAELVINEPDGPAVRRIVGVVTNVRASGGDLRAWPEVFVPYAQSPLGLASFVVRSAAGANIEAGIRGAMGAFDAGLPVDRVETLQAVVRRSVATQRFFAMLMGAFAAVAVALAFVGLYSVAAWSVTQRTREIGVRLAIGATPADIRRLVLRYGAAVGLAGAASGAACAYASTRLIESHLYGFNARQPAIFATLAVVFVAIVTLASYLPARRATRINPMAVLRTE